MSADWRRLSQIWGRAVQCGPMIYLDYNATTPIAPEVLEAMMPYLTTEWGNPSSSYGFGSKLKAVIEKARRQVAELIGASPREIIFTSCATESNNTAIHAAIKASPAKRHIITSAVEHSSVLAYCKALEQEGYRVTYLPVDREGLLKLADLENAITEETAVVSLMWANNETGVLFPVKEIAEHCRSRGVLYHCDAVQAIGKTPVDVSKVTADYLSLTGHKLGAPKGIGALYMRRKSPFRPYLLGGHQEHGMRGGSDNVPLIVALGSAAELAGKGLPTYVKKVLPVRKRLEDGILTSFSGTNLNGNCERRLANTANISFIGVSAESLLLLLDNEGICASAGAACLADSTEPSHVIESMAPGTGRAAIRFSVGTSSSSADADACILGLRRCLAMLRPL